VRRAWIVVLLVLLILAIAITAPIFYAGWRNLESADAAAAEGKYADAARLYESAARQLPWRADLWEMAGLTAFRAQDADNTSRLLQLAEGRAPLSVDGWIALGSALWIRGEPAAAIAAWGAGLAKHPGSSALLDRLIAAYDHEGYYAAEEIALRTRLASGQEPAASYRLGLILMTADPNAAEAEIHTAAALDPEYESAAETLSATIHEAAGEPDTARRLIVIGRGLGLVREWGLAVKAFEQGVRANPSDAEAWAWLGEAQQHIGENGLPALDEGLRLGPLNAIVHGLRALYWSRRGEHDRALAEQLQAAAIEPQNAGIQSALGQAYAAAGDLVSALAAFQQATTLAPDDAVAWRRLAAFCADNGIQVQIIGVPAALKAASLAKNDAQTLDVLGWSYTQAGLTDAAEQTLLQAIQASPDLTAAHLHLAETYLRTGDFAAAEQQLTTTAQLDPSGPDGQFASQLLMQYFP
jgi:tetratricopeptide (TPR) repeat protein